MIVSSFKIRLHYINGILCRMHYCCQAMLLVGDSIECVLVIK